MATISIAGKVTCKQGSEPVSLKTFEDGGKSASFSVRDEQYFYVKQGEERFGQFYNVQVNGKAAEFALERLERGDRVAISGQLVQRTYNDKLYLDIKNAQITFLEPRRDGAGAPGEDEVPF
jgi:single-stranded DNA-binding protein